MIKEFRILVSLALSNEQKTVPIPIEMAGEILDIIDKFDALPPKGNDDSPEIYCPDCGTRIYFQQKHCGECGKMIDWDGK